MRIIQIIDSLEAGGAEKMAVNYANVLCEEIEFSGLIATRGQGVLVNSLNKNVDYLYLNKKSKFDLKAIWNLKKYCSKNKVEIIQAHSSSFFLGCLIKIVLPKIKLIWHDHNGGVVPKREDQIYIKIFSIFFNGIISVNQELKTWALKTLYCKKIIYLSNFSVQAVLEKKETELKGISGKRILCLANLRIQKNHLMLVNMALKLKNSNPDWTFHFVGKDFQDDYSQELKTLIHKNNLHDVVFLYDSRQDIENIISQSDICVFSSISEGLPVSLLEFGNQKKAVLSTKVGEIQYIIQDDFNGFLSNVDDVNDFYAKLIVLIENPILRQNLGKNLFQTISENHSKIAVIKNYLIWTSKL
ncbi:MAG: glycosyltransferase [Flavobacterium sp.]|nr:glycosyltransferase [Flavobacterium sp.]